MERPAVFLTFYAISNISRKKNLGIQNNYFSLNVFFFFLNLTKSEIRSVEVGSNIAQNHLYMYIQPLGNHHDIILVINTTNFSRYGRNIF